MPTKSIYQRLRQFMSVPEDNPKLLQAQYRAFSQQIPLLYLTLLANTWLLAYSFRDTAPQSLTFYVPAFLTIVCGARLIGWRRSINDAPTHDIVVKALGRTNRLASLISVAFASWSIALFPYGDAYGQAQIAFYMAITVIACIFCLMHLRSAAVTVALVVNVAFVGFFGLSGNPAFIATAVNVAVVSFVMLAILMVNYRDFTAMIAAQENAQALSDENFRIANLDPLTGLPNRRQFFAHLDREFQRARAGNRRLAVGVMDLDGFKPVNDLYGHATGDALLIEAGNRLREVCGTKLHLARIGGDEFAVVVADVVDDNELLSAGRRMCDVLRVPFYLGGATVQVSASIGFAIYPDLADNASALFERADYALFRSKRELKGRATLFSSEHAAEIHGGATIEQALHAADLEQELVVLFQPIIELKTNKTVGFEALARWQSPLVGDVSPAVFIPIAERMGIVTKLTRVLLEKALAAANSWPDDISLSFNLSAKDISTPEGVMRLIATILASGFDPKRLDLEITETAIMHDFDEAHEAIDTLKSLGCGICLDDFGTGYSSLTQLHSLPLTKLKIDRSFVTGLHVKPASHKIVKSLIALTRDMGLGCVVEGVETDEELDALRALGCTQVQGYKFSKPLPEDAVLNFLSRAKTPLLESALA
jgi:diguanylate cyclase (GGDEF)-like protein